MTSSFVVEKKGWRFGCPLGKCKHAPDAVCWSLTYFTEKEKGRMYGGFAYVILGSCKGAQTGLEVREYENGSPKGNELATLFLAQ